MDGMRVLVTGGAGFIGRRLVGRLGAAGAEVTVLDAMLARVHGEDAPDPELEGARFVRGDVRDPEAWRTAAGGGGADGPDVVVHLAAETGTGESMYRTRHYVDANAGGTAVLCDLVVARALRPRRVVLASSRAVYGEGPYRTLDGRGGKVVYPGPRRRADLEAGRWEPRGPAGEPLEPVAAAASWTRPVPSSVYGAAKLAQEHLLHAALPPMGVATTALRLQNVYGAGQSLLNPYTGILSIFSAQLLRGEPVRLFEDGLASRDFVHVDDVCNALAEAVEHEPPGGSATLDAGSGVRTTIADAAEMLRRELGAPAGAVVVTGEFRMGDVRHAWAAPPPDVPVAASAPGAPDAAQADDDPDASVPVHRPPTPLARGLREFAQWVRSRPAADLPSAGALSPAAALDEMAQAGLLGRSRRPPASAP